MNLSMSLGSRTSAKEEVLFADVQGMKTRASWLVCLPLLLGTALTSLSGQTVDETGSRTRILALEHAWNQAEAFKDLKALDTLFDNALVYVDFDGTLMTKAEFLSRVKSAHLQQVVTQSMNVELFGDTAIVTGIYQASEVRDGKPLVRRGRFIDTWMYKSSGWVCIAAQSTPILR